MVEMLPEISRWRSGKHLPARLRPPSGRIAADLCRWGKQSFWIAAAVALAASVAGGIYAASVPDNVLWQRLAIFAFLGLLPGLLAFLLGCALRVSLKGASIAFDPAAAKVRVACGGLARWFIGFSRPFRLKVNKFSHWSLGMIFVLQSACRKAAGRAGALSMAVGRSGIGSARALAKTLVRSAWSLAQKIPVCLAFVGRLGRSAPGALRGVGRQLRVVRHGCIAARRFSATLATYPVRFVARTVIRMLPSAA